MARTAKKVEPMKMVLAKPTVEELNRILEGEDGHEVVSCGSHGILAAVPVTDFRAELGGFLDNVTAGRRLALTRKGKVIAILIPPETDRRLPTVDELDEVLARCEAEERGDGG